MQQKKIVENITITPEEARNFSKKIQETDRPILVLN
jgi:hypothetical protein